VRARVFVVHTAHVRVQVFDTGECLRTLRAFVQPLFGMRVEIFDRDVVQSSYGRICVHCNVLDSKNFYK